MAVNIILDSCIWGGAKQFLETSGIDCKWVGDFLKDPGDEAIMRLAAKEHRCIVTLDKDFGELAIFRGVPHEGIIRLVGFSALRHGEVTLKIIQQYHHELSQKSIITVEQDRIRIRLS